MARVIARRLAGRMPISSISTAEAVPQAAAKAKPEAETKPAPTAAAKAEPIPEESKAAPVSS